MPKLSCSRLDLVPATIALLDAELESAPRLGALLGAVMPGEWPTGEYDRRAIEFFRATLAANPEAFGWLGWYALLRPAGDALPTLVGAGGFFGPPDEDGVVEVGYSVVTAFRDRGLATELVGCLVDHAFSTGRVTQVIAHTTPENVASVRVLERSGFVFEEPGKEPGTVRYRMLATGRLICGRDQPPG